MKAFTSFCIISCLISTTVSDTLSEIYGDELLDHYETYVSGPYGSPRAGEFFTDFYQSLDGSVVRPKHWPSQINIGAGERIDSIEIIYGPYHGGFHGGEGGVLHKVRLYDGDRVVRITGRRGIGPGAGIDGLTLHTQQGRVHGPFGGSGGVPFVAAPPQGKDCYLACISGRAFLRVDALVFHWRCPLTYDKVQEVESGIASSATATTTTKAVTSLTGKAQGRLRSAFVTLIAVLVSLAIT